MNNMPNFLIISDTNSSVEEKLNELKVDHMVKIIGFATTDDRHCQVLLVATPKQQDEDMMD